MPVSRTVRALFLDFDGVVCDTERAAHRSWQELFAESGLPFPPALWQRMSGSSAGADLAAQELGRLRGRDLHPDELARRAARKAELATAEPLRPGIAALIRQAGMCGVPVAVVSSSPRSWVHSHLGRLGVLDRLSFVVTGDDSTRHKPHPDLYQLALGRTGVAAADAIAVEDSAPGIRAAGTAGIWCIAVCSGADPGAAAADASLESVVPLRLTPSGQRETAVITMEVDPT